MRMQRKSMLFALLTMLFVGLSYLYAMKQVVKAEEFGAWEYRLINDGAEVEITGYKNTLNGDLQIPDSIDGKPVTSIGYSAFYGCSGLTSLELPSGLTSIGMYAFQDCSGLTSLELPSGLTSIGDDYDIIQLKLVQTA